MSIPARPLPFDDSPRPDGGLVDGAGWRAAALARGYTFRDRWENPPFPGLLFRNGSSVVATDVVQSVSVEHPFIAGGLNAEYVAGSGTAAASFIAIRLPRSMPNIVLVNARRGALRRAGIGMGSRQMMRLQGSYDRAFTLYCPIGAERVAEEIFTAELMEVFLESLPGGDIELFDDWMFVYDEEQRFTSQGSLDRVERVALRVQDEVVRRDFASLHDEPVLTETRDAPTPMRGAQFVAVIALSVVAAVAAGVWAVVAH